MSKEVVVCGPDDTITTAARLMAMNHVGSLPVVVDPDTRELSGLLTDRDIVLRVVAAERDPRSTQVGQVMTRELITCRPADDLDEAVSLMMRHRIRRILVAQNGRLMGIIAQADVASRGGERNATAQLVERVSQPGAPEPANL